MDPHAVSVGLAFLAGLASFLSPCVLSLVPAYIGYLGSRAITTDGAVAQTRRATMSHALFFVLGFSLVFVALGALAGSLGLLLVGIRSWLTKIGGLVVIVLGLYTMGVIHIPFLEYDKRVNRPPDPRWGYLSSSMMGVFFSAGWSPCVGPVLGAVLTLALSANAAGQGALLLTAYSLGLGIPFLLTAAGVAPASSLLKRHKHLLRYANPALGALLILIGVLIFTDSLQALASYTFVSDFQTSLDDGVVSFWRWLTGGGR
jgi:cytochrome c-type biogenesis protein